MKNIQIMNFANDDNEYLNIGHIYYQSKKWLLYSFITVPGMFEELVCNGFCQLIIWK